MIKQGQRLKTEEWENTLAFFRKYLDKNYRLEFAKIVSDRNWYKEQYEKTTRELKNCLQPELFAREEKIREGIDLFRNREIQAFIERGDRLYHQLLNKDDRDIYKRIRPSDFEEHLKEANTWGKSRGLPQIIDEVEDAIKTST